MGSDETWDVIVVGAGHAGCEAAHAAARLGCRALLLTLSLDTVGWMSCNPAIGGLAKGQIVREIDALGGLMGRLTDRAAIQTRILNTGKGPAVRAPRAQCDKRAYAAEARWALERTPGLSLRQERVTGLWTEGGRIAGVVGQGERYRARAVVLTTGTFLRGLLHEGDSQTRGGRAGDGAAYALSDALRELGFELGRLKTGTPPRLHGATLDLDRMRRQDGLDPPYRFSFGPAEPRLAPRPCYVTHTNQATTAIIRQNLHRSPLCAGRIEGTGARYCPSVEEKIVRFPGRDRHILFCEPEGHKTEEVYLNGLSTSLPRDVQRAAVRSIVGLERAEITRYGYAVEYDYLPPHQLRRTLETRRVPGLYIAGQIAGTSGYEEAAGQGLWAGINAAHALKDAPPFVLGRDQAYLGVLLSDLVSLEHREPYRMFSSRAEFRLLLRAENADRRLSPLGLEIGLLAPARRARLDAKLARIAALETYLAEHRREGRALGDLLRRQDVRLSDLAASDPRLAELASDNEVAGEVEVSRKYEGYIRRQQRDVERLRRLESKRLPPVLDYRAIGSISNEARGKLERTRPETLGQAGRIAGVTPADLHALAVWLRGQRPRKRKTPRSPPADTGVA